jgi:hypothetical protein
MVEGSERLWRPKAVGSAHTTSAAINESESELYVFEIRYSDIEAVEG